MTESLRSIVSRRARHRCEYCRLHEDDLPRQPFHLEHVIARKHGGTSALGNLAWSCQLCNLFKGSDLSGLDAQTGKVVQLFNPRRQKWARHFAWKRPWAVGKTAIGRATVTVLRMNLPHRRQLRAFLMQAGLFPPTD
jgi:hypothetical protein